jgi:tetratricopeptide (TPR) repeat protein
MAKHRRLSSKRVSSKPSGRPVAPVTIPVVRRGNGRDAASNASPDAHTEAVRTYERGVEALQQREYSRASQLLKRVLEQYPDEKELHERVRLYLNVCHRQAAPPDPTPKTPEERVYAATLAINAGAYDTGLSQLQLALEADPTNDHIHYMLGVVSALRRDFASALAHLQRAIELNPENRFLALQDADLDGLREAAPTFRTIVASAFSARRDRRDSRPRPAR